MDGEELAVDERTEGERVERADAGFVNCLGVLVQACVTTALATVKERLTDGRVDAHSLRKVKNPVKCLHSWLPRSRLSALGYQSFNVYRYSRH